MKKILFLLICTLLVGCYTPSEIPDPIIIDEKPIRKCVRPYHFEYNGHKYIYFSGRYDGYIVHDPDCCKEGASIW